MCTLIPDTLLIPMFYFFNFASFAGFNINLLQKKVIFFYDTLWGQNQKLLVLVIESKTGFTWSLGVLVKEMLSGICDDLKIQSQNYPS